VLLTRFLDFVGARSLTLYPAQEEAVLALFEERNVILNTPTGSGKSLVAAALHFKSFSEGKRSVYTCPIKALVNEKWMDLCREFGAENVGLATGDATINRDAPILCCTAEILSNIALRHGPTSTFADVVMDEFHYYSDRDRGVAWQIPLLTLNRSRFPLMSATLGDITFFADELTRLNGLSTAPVISSNRPVPLEFSYAETPLAVTLQSLAANSKTPAYVVHFTQAEAAESAQDFTSLTFCTREEKAAIAQAIEGFKFSSPYGPEIKRWLRHGIGIHHAGLLPKYRILVEQLTQKGLLKVVCGTDTLGVGVNVPIRTVLFSKLCKFDGQKTTILSARDFHQIAGRAGRKGFDNVGWVVAQAPEHMVENLKLEEKSSKDGKRITRKKPPEKNFVNWDKNTFHRLISSAPERLSSRFEVTHSMVLNLLGRPGNGCRALRDLIARSHDSPKAKRAHTKRAWLLFRSLLDQGIVEFTQPTEQGEYLRVNVDLQSDFSMDQTLSLYVIDTIPKMDPAAPAYALDLLTLVESILENPDAILRKQLDRAKTRRMSELKLQGVEYDQRIEELEKVEYPKPNQEFLYQTFNAFAARHPWVAQENIKPKAIVREMIEEFRSFSDYVRDYDLQRSEGVLLRHISSVHRVLTQTVPVHWKNDTLREVELYLLTMIRQVDSSLLDEWQRMKAPIYPNGSNEIQDQSHNTPARYGFEDPSQRLASQIRISIFAFLKCLSNNEYDEAIQLLEFKDNLDGDPITSQLLADRFAAFSRSRTRMCFDPEARNLRHTYIQPMDASAELQVQQMIVDLERVNDWVLEFRVDVSRSLELGLPALRFVRLDNLGNIRG